MSSLGQDLPPIGTDISTPPSTTVPRLPINPKATHSRSGSSSSSNTRPKPIHSASHIRKRSIDPSEIISNSPTARRMSMSSTPQDATKQDEGPVARALRYAEWVTAGLCAWSLLTGTLYSIIFSTSLPTSIASTPLSTSYFADTHNPINQYFVKLTWLHTSIIYLAHLYTSSSRQTKFRRFAMYVLATAMWVGFTGFFFGRGLGDRVIEMSGGSCGLLLPEGLDLKDQAGRLLSDANVNIVDSSEGQLLQLPNTFCKLRKPLTPLSHPDLFKSLSASTSSSGNPLSSLVPKWRRGFDISGHSFLLPLSSVLLTHELAPTWRHWAGILPMSGQNVHSNNGRGYLGLVNAIIGLLGTMLVQLWVWMLGMTGAYFHDPKEKLAGLAMGLAASALLSLAPESPFSPVPARRVQSTHRRLSSIVEVDENAARKGLLVEDGVIISPVDEKSGLEDAIKGTSPLQGKKEKAKDQ